MTSLATVVPAFMMIQNLGHVISRRLRPTSYSKSGTTEQCQDWQICCIIQGESVTFPIKLSRNHDISELKSLVLGNARHGVLRDVDSKDLAPYKVRNVFRSAGGNNTSSNVLCLIR